ncbi:MAG: hypothetical protein ACO1Q7_11325, partial [Gemmatimonas sp.]
MTGSSRVSSNAIRAPYAAPQMPLSPSSPTSGQGGRGAVGRTPGAMLTTAPFVPPAFRAAANVSNVSSVPFLTDHVPTSTPWATPVAEDRQAPTPTAGVNPTPSAGLPSVLFDTDEAPAPDFAEFVDAGREEIVPAQELPWIDAFAVDAPATDADDSWPMGEAGKRLDELTQSLTSLDGSRERQLAGPRSSQPSPSANPAGAGRPSPRSNPALPMWSEEEWIDIMPSPHADVDATRAAAQSQAAPLLADPYEAPATRPSNARATASVNVESAARALE